MPEGAEFQCRNDRDVQRQLRLGIRQATRTVKRENLGDGRKLLDTLRVPAGNLGRYMRGCAVVTIDSVVA